MKKIVDSDGTQRWYNEKDQLHREDGPAVIYESGTQYWYKNGKLHREDDLPAVIKADGDKSWWINGKKHRGNDLPAVITLNGARQEWWVNGKLHRENNLPAIYCPLGKKVLKNGFSYWEYNGQLHNWPFCAEEYWVNGKLHRLDGPARTGWLGSTDWYKEGQKHREDGPAVIWPNGKEEYWINGKQIKKEKTVKEQCPFTEEQLKSIKEMADRNGRDLIETFELASAMICEDGENCLLSFVIVADEDMFYKPSKGIKKYFEKFDQHKDDDDDWTIFALAYRQDVGENPCCIFLYRDMDSKEWFVDYKNKSLPFDTFEQALTFFEDTFSKLNIEYSKMFE